ncbi:hypothetical protein [Rhizobium cremeum]|uniref:hypothetical protein n=1 Tax=Rhizobium cremeum TaxID=2813827 RepID=UPI0039E16914
MAKKAQTVTIKRHRDGSISMRSTGGFDLRRIFGTPDDADAKRQVLEKLASHDGLLKIERRKLATLSLSNLGKVYTAELRGDLYACSIPRSDLARLQEELARHKLAYQAGPHSPERDEEYAQAEAQIARRFSDLGLHPSYPTGFL